MLCRGYSRNVHVFVKKKPLPAQDWTILLATLCFLVLVPVLTYLTYPF